jgi:general secretion pathway protein F
MIMPNFRYHALTQAGEVVSGLISAPTAAEVARRIDYLRLVPIDPIVEESAAKVSRFDFNFGTQARDEVVTIFTLDLALLLRAGARIDDALELLATATDIGRLGPTIAKIRASVLSGESFADSLSHHQGLFSPMYIALVRVGEASGSLDRILEMLANERTRSATLRRKLADALRYPAFLLFAAGSVLVFFLTFVMPQFGTVLRDFGGKLDSTIMTFLHISEFMNAHKDMIGVAIVASLTGGLLIMRQPRWRAAMLSRISRLPLVRSIFVFHRTALFCRNLGVLLAAADPLTVALRILVDMMATMGDEPIWTRAVERVRQGRKLSDAIGESTMLPAMAVRMLRLGEETGQLPVLAGRVAELYETKLQRSLDRIVAIVGPLAIITISVVVGGLIVSVMTSLLSVSQMVG